MSEPTEPSTFPMKRCADCRLLNPPDAARCRSCHRLNFEEIKPGLDLSQPPAGVDSSQKLFHLDLPATGSASDDDIFNQVSLPPSLLEDPIYTHNDLSVPEIDDQSIKSKSDRRDLRSAIAILVFLGLMTLVNSAFGRVVNPSILLTVLAGLLLLAGSLISPNRTGPIFIKSVKILLWLIVLYFMFAIAVFIALFVICIIAR